MAAAGLPAMMNQFKTLAYEIEGDFCFGLIKNHSWFGAFFDRSDRS